MVKTTTIAVVVVAVVEVATVGVEVAAAVVVGRAGRRVLGA